MKATLESVDIRDRNDGELDLVFNFSNDRHHLMVFKNTDTNVDVVNKLRNIADRMQVDPLLEE